MKVETKSKLLNEYSKLDYPKETTAIKYIYKYNFVNVNVFFDAFDNENLNLSLVLVYAKQYYYTSLNINNTEIIKEYLFKIPSDILGQILDNNDRLDSFFASIEQHILSEKPKFINYTKDVLFSNTLKYSKNRKDLPFLCGIRRVPMSEDMYNTLCVTMGIDKELLGKIRKRNMTLVRTSDPNKRMKLTIILDKALEC